MFYAFLHIEKRLIVKNDRFKQKVNAFHLKTTEVTILQDSTINYKPIN